MLFEISGKFTTLIKIIKILKKVLTVLYFIIKINLTHTLCKKSPFLHNSINPHKKEPANFKTARPGLYFFCPDDKKMFLYHL
jgi:hypothetical protein